MVEMEKMEQRGQAVKRFRSLFDMHHVAFGAAENLGGVLLSLHEDRHFAMDFWSVVNALSSQEAGAPSDAELLETVIESATGKGSAALPAYERPGVEELRLMLSGVDTARPTELPDAIARPSDALLAQPEPMMKSSAAEMAGGTYAQVTRRSIGDALARLEQTSRELREQLAALDGRAVEDDRHEVAVENAVAPATMQEAASAPDAARAAASVPPIAEEQSKAARPIPVEVVSAPLVAAEQHLPSQPAQPSAAAGAEVFERRPVRELSHRGLAIPDADDDPSIVAPLSGYATQQESEHAARYAIAVVVIAAVAAGGFFGARTEKGHAMLGAAASQARLAYAEAKDKIGLQANAPVEAPPPPPVAAAVPSNGATAPSADVDAVLAGNAAPNPLEAQKTATVDAKPVDAKTPAEVPASAAAPVAVQPARKQLDAKQPAPKPVAEEHPPLKQPAAQPGEEALAAARALERQRAEVAASATLQRVPGAIMARNLIASRLPVYPQAAKTQEIEGPVELEVVVTPQGAVKYARAVSGDPHLRTAAEEAVMKWRYRPYIENGSALEVVTTARVDFRLPQ